MTALRRLSLRVVDVGMRQDIETAHGKHQGRPLYFLELEGEVIARAEVIGLEQPPSGDPQLSAVIETLRSKVLPTIAERSLAPRIALSAEAIHTSFNADPATSFACHAIEALLLDLWSKESAVSLTTRLSRAEPRSPQGRTWLSDLEVQPQPSPQDRIRVKVNPLNVLERAQALRSGFPDTEITLDANASLTGLGDRELEGIMGPLEALGNISLEQPLARQDLVGHAELRASWGLPIYLDETLTSIGVLRSVARYGSADGVLLKPARMGGALSTAQALDECRTLGLAAGLGGMFEGTLGRCVNQALAHHPAVSLASDIGPASEYLLGDPFGEAGEAGFEGDLNAHSGWAAIPSEYFSTAVTIETFALNLGAMSPPEA